MREDIVFEELIEQIDLILNSSKPLPYHMKAERKFLILMFVLCSSYACLSISNNSGIPVLLSNLIPIEGLNYRYLLLMLK